MIILWKCTDPHAILDVEEFLFVFLSEQICRNFTLHHLLTNVYSEVNGCRQNEPPIKTSQKSINNPHNSSPSINIVKRYVFVGNKS